MMDLFESFFSSNLSFRMLVEAYDVAVEWTRTANDQWTCIIDTGSKRYEASFWYFGGPWKDKWKVQFYQQTDTGLTTYDRTQPVGLGDLIGLFTGLDKAMLELFSERDDVSEIQIHPEAVGLTRREKVKKRMNKKGAGAGYAFDENKFNAYKMVFSHSKLADLGFTMEEEGEILVVRRPDQGEFAAAVSGEEEENELDIDSSP